MAVIDGESFLKLVRMEASTSRFNEGIGDDAGLHGAVTSVEIFGAVQELLLRHGLIVVKVVLASLLGLTR